MAKKNKEISKIDSYKNFSYKSTEVILKRKVK